jgi:hypothetical protein
MKTIARSQAIEGLRRELVKLVSDGRSLCLVAARRGLFCGGFERWSAEQLALRIPDGLQAGPGITRAELERQANRWQLGLQDAPTGRLPCDGDGACLSRLCAGWDEFYEGELAGFYREMCGEEVRVVPDELFEPAPFRPLRPALKSC